MKLFIFLFVFIISAKIEANDISKKFFLLYKKGFHYSSYTYLKESVRKGEKSVSKEAVNNLLESIHPSVFIHDTDLDEFRNIDSDLNYAVGIRSFIHNDLKTSQDKLQTINKGSTGYVESTYLLSLISSMKGDKEAANRNLDNCISEASNLMVGEQSVKLTKLKIFKSRCILQKSRISFEDKKFLKTIDILNQIDKRDYVWPKTLFDRAWAFYSHKKYSQALGTILTLNAPLMKRFMEPELVYLKGLIYYEMCYYDKAEKTYKQYVETLLNNAKFLKDVSNKSLIRFILGKEKLNTANELFLYDILRGYKRDLRFLTFIHETKRIRDEVKMISKSNVKSFEPLVKILKGFETIIYDDFELFLKEIVIDYHDQIVGINPAFIKLNLMLGQEKRIQILSKDQTPKKQTEREKALIEITDGTRDFVFEFKGGFWADELGDYAIALDSNCVRK